ncbi:MAG TPA: DNA polymerase [Rhodocyclaceae bacterium]|nr:DNA polymerase [Rhodocyclaceae bacterium]
MAQLFPIVVDYETFWTPTHSLSKMSPMAYVMHPDTEVISCAIKEGDKPTYCIFGEANVRYALQQIDWSNKILIAHNNEGFDAMISAWRFGIKPAMWACTLAMARPYHAKTCGLSLAKLVEHYQLGVKDNTALVKTQGKRLKDFTPDEIRAMSAYNTADTDQCFQLFKLLLAKTPRDELRIIDSCIRMLVEPAFELDVDLLTDTLAKEKQRKRDTVLKLARFLGVDGIDAQEEVTNTLASAPKFSALLEQLGAEVPMKPSPTDPDKLIPALAKTDQGMLDLLESDNEIVAAAAEARLGVKSTLLETRIQKFLESAAACGGRLPIPVKYYGADTTGRLSGWSYNPLNLPRINPYEPKLSDALRKSMRAPKGFKVVVADLSGIELRVNHFLWKEPESMALFRADPEKADLYKSFASALYGVEVAEVSKTQRQLGKIAQLGLGFGAGAATFKKVAKTMGGVDIPLEAAPVPLEFLDADGYLTPEGQAWEQSQPTAAKDVVSKWRDKYGEIVRGWRVCHQALSSIYAGSDDTVDPWHMISTTPEGFKTPRGFILYPELRQEVDEKSGKVEWKYGAGRHTARIYAGKVTENCLAANTLVLTRCGWKPIVEVQPADMLWDGVQWVRHAGVVPMGVKPVMDFGGVSITPDHKVLINDEWVEARAASYRQAASSYKGPGGVPDPHAGSGRLRGERRAQKVRAVEVFDVLNCGPLNRFTVKSAGGNPFIVHNCVQHLARSIINDHKLAVRKATGRLPAMEVYDELVYVVPEAEAESHLATLLSVMRTPPTWWPELVLWAEGDIADTYGDAK